LRFIKLGIVEDGGAGFIWMLAVIVLDESSLTRETKVVE
jgi:hypothetical protein